MLVLHAPDLVLEDSVGFGHLFVDFGLEVVPELVQLVVVGVFANVLVGLLHVLVLDFHVLRGVHVRDVAAGVFAVEFANDAAHGLHESDFGVHLLLLLALLDVVLVPSFQADLHFLEQLLAVEDDLALLLLVSFVVSDLLLALSVLLTLDLLLSTCVASQFSLVERCQLPLLLFLELDLVLLVGLLSLILHVWQNEVGHLLLVAHELESVQLFGVHLDILVVLEHVRDIAFLVRHGADASDVQPKVELDLVVDSQLAVGQVHLVDLDVDADVAEEGLLEQLVLDLLKHDYDVLLASTHVCLLPDNVLEQHAGLLLVVLDELLQVPDRLNTAVIPQLVELKLDLLLLDELDQLVVASLSSGLLGLLLLILELLVSEALLLRARLLLLLDLVALRLVLLLVVLLLDDVRWWLLFEWSKGEREELEAVLELVFVAVLELVELVVDQLVVSEAVLDVVLLAAASSFLAGAGVVQEVLEVVDLPDLAVDGVGFRKE